MFGPFLGNEKVRISGLGFIIAIMNACMYVWMYVWMDVCMYGMVWYGIALHCNVLYCMYVSIV